MKRVLSTITLVMLAVAMFAQGSVSSIDINNNDELKKALIGEWTGDVPTSLLGIPEEANVSGNVTLGIKTNNDMDMTMMINAAPQGITISAIVMVNGTYTIENGALKMDAKEADFDIIRLDLPEQMEKMLKAQGMTKDQLIVMMKGEMSKHLNKDSFKDMNFSVKQITEDTLITTISNNGKTADISYKRTK